MQLHPSDGAESRLPTSFLRGALASDRQRPEVLLLASVAVNRLAQTDVWSVDAVHIYNTNNTSCWDRPREATVRYTPDDADFLERIDIDLQCLLTPANEMALAHAR